MEIIRIQSEKDLPVLSKQVTNEDFIWYVCNSTLKRIHEHGEDELVEVLGKHFDSIMDALGIKKGPSKEAASKMMFFMRRNYGYLYPAEVELAFDLAMTGKLEVKLDHFQDFNLLYLTSVLREYVKYRSRILHDKAKDKAPKSLAEKIEISQSELKKKELAHLVEFWEEFAANGWSNFEYRFAYIYGILIRHGNKPDIFTNGGDKGKEMMAKALPIAEGRKQKIERDNGQRAVTDMTKAISDMFGHEVLRVAKELIVVEYFEKLKTDGRTIQQAIEIWNTPKKKDK